MAGLSPDKEEEPLKPFGLLGGVWEFVRWLVRVFLSAGDRFYWDNQFSKAASLAYSTLFSLVPMTLLAFALLTSFAVPEESLSELREFFFRQFVPGTSATLGAILAYLSEFAANMGRLNTIIVIYLVITALLLMNSIEYALNEIWQVAEPRTIPNRIATFCAMIVLAPVMAISIYSTTRIRVEPFLTGLGMSPTFWSVYVNFLPLVIDFTAFLALYYLVPLAPIRFRSASFGALVASVLFNLAKEGFALYLLHFSSYEQVYGALAAIPLFLFWLYLAWLIVLFGCECAYQFQYLPRRGSGWRRSVLAVGDGRLVLGVQALVIVIRAYLDARPLPNDWELAEQLECSSTLLKTTLVPLERAGIISRGQSREMPIALLRTPERITLRDIHAVLRPRSKGPHCAEELGRLFEAFAGGKEREGVTLKDIVEREVE